MDHKYERVDVVKIIARTRVPCLGTESHMRLEGRGFGPTRKEALLKKGNYDKLAMPFFISLATYVRRAVRHTRFMMFPYV